MRIYNMYSYVCMYIYIYDVPFFKKNVYLFIYLSIYLFMCLFISTYIMCIGTLYKHITTSHHPRSKAHALQRRIARGKGQATRETSLARHSTEALRHDNSMADGPGWSSTSCGPGCSSHMVFFHNLNRNPSPKGKSPMLRWRYVMGI